MITGLGDLLNTFPYRRAVRKVDSLMRLTPPEREAFQNERVRELVRYAYDHVELYRRKWDEARVHPDQILTRRDLNKLPITTKDDLRTSDLSEILSRGQDPQDHYVISTSGSTGSPLRFHIDPYKAMLETALSIPKYLVGIPPVSPWRAIRDFLIRRDIAFMAIVLPGDYLYHQMFWMMKHTVVDSLESAHVHISRINRRCPQVLYTYPSTLRHICAAAREKRMTMHRPDAILVVGEMVDIHLRESVREVFGTELYDIYGATEGGHIAAECACHKGLHVLDIKVILELLDENGDEVQAGEVGQVVVTDLFSRPPRLFVTVASVTLLPGGLKNVHVELHFHS
jgi:phenylacetate-CoA ligase